MEGMKNKAILHYVNTKGYKPGRKDKFSTKLVWGLMDEYKLRPQKRNEVNIRVEEVG